MRLIHLSIVLFHVVLGVSCRDSIKIDVNWRQTRPSNKEKPPYIPPPIVKPPCKTGECDDFEMKFEANIAPQISPCQDFYEHACNGWISHHSLQKRALVDQYTAIKRRVYTMVNVDIEENSIKRLKEVIKEAGGWPLIRDPDEEASPLSWQQVHAIYTTRTDISALFKISVTIHHKNSSMHVITVSPPDEEVNGLEFSGNPRKRRDMFSNIQNFQYIADVASALYSGGKNITRVMSFSRDVQEIIEFEGKLSELRNVGFDDDTDNEIKYQVMTIEKLQQAWDDVTPLRSRKYNVNWLKIIKGLFAPTNIKITANEPVALLPGKYLMGLSQLIMMTEKRVVVNYIHWNVIHRLLKYTTRKMRDIRNVYQSNMFGAEGVDRRWLTCVDEFQLEHALTVIIGHTDLFRRQQIDIRRMTEAIKAELRKEIMASTWLLEEEMQEAALKIENIEEVVGYPDWTRDPDKVDEYYKDLIVTNYDYLLNVLRVNVHRRLKELKTLRMPVNKYNLPWDMRTFDFVATFDQHTNHIVIPAGLLDHPYIRFQQLPVTQWGSLGALIGHEIGHGFDNEGRLYDKDGNKNKWWSDYSIEEYNRRADCFIRKYGSYNITLGYEVIPINGTITLRENIADNLGFLVSFKAFKEYKKTRSVKYSLPKLSTKYTEEQLWFYSLAHTFCENVSKQFLRNVYAQIEHPPARVRINGALSGMKEFSDTFNCKDGDPMKVTEATRCPIWGH